ncbi:MAG: response regulator, partial [Pseudomonadota bacterium]
TADGGPSALALMGRLARQLAPVVARPLALLADEDGSARRQLARDLEARGFEVDASDDIGGALMSARRRPPALLVLELRLGGGSGLDLLARLRPELPNTRFVVLTHYGSVASAVRAMRLGANNYLCKPVAVDEVLRAACQAASNEVDATVTNIATTPIGELPAPGPTTLTLDEAIWEYINRTIEDAGSLSEAARRLGIWRQSLKRMVSKYRPPAPAAAPVAAGRR